MRRHPKPHTAIAYGVFGLAGEEKRKWPTESRIIDQHDITCRDRSERQRHDPAQPLEVTTRPGRDGVSWC